ncbi:MAG: TolC family outer membrane protein [Sphingopyxis sp.]
MMRLSPFRTLLLTTSGCLLLAAPLRAETLREALAAAYENNPTLTGARAGQRATDEGVPIARADGLPSLGASVGYTEQVLQASNSFFNPDRILSVSGQLTVPIYQGGVVRNAVRAAETRVEAGQAELRGTEASVFSQVVGAYMDVLRDEAVVALNRNNVEVLIVNLQATRDRFDIGDLTRTDVAQSEARLATARSQLQSVEARLIASRESYIRLVGHAPADLVSPPPLPGLPDVVDAAVESALADNPDLEAAQRDADASGFDVRSARGTRMPRLSFGTSGGHSDFLGSVAAPAAPTTTSATSSVTMTIPLFQGGRPAARVRQAQARQSQAMERVIGTERSVIAQTRAAFASWRAAGSVAASSQIAVDANRLSLEGVRAENSVGTRTILDILNAEQELLNSQVQLVTAQRDAYVAGFTLLAAMGRGEAEDIGLDGGTLYDPDTNYARVRGRIWDWDEDPAPGTVATRTRGTDAQTADVSEKRGPELTP